MKKRTPATGTAQMGARTAPQTHSGWLKVRLP